jgi:inositol transport system substrate-binding protein
MVRLPRPAAFALVVLALVAACDAGPLLPSAPASVAPATNLGVGADLAIGVSLPGPDLDPFLATVVEGARARAAELGTVELHPVDAAGKADTQLEQVQGLLDAGVDALVVVPVDAAATDPIRDLAAAAGVPLVWLNRRPYDLAPDGSTPFVGSDSLQDGTLEMQALADRVGGRGGVGILMGDPLTEAAVVRTEGCKDVAARYPALRVTREEVAGSRDRAREVVTGWLSDPNVRIDAICANDDELALGAIAGLTDAGRLDGVAVGGVDGMAEAVDELVAGRLATTVFEDAAGQGRAAVDTATALARGRTVETVEGSILLPGELVTPDNVDGYLGRNVPPVPGG